jgi:hypothetical protein
LTFGKPSNGSGLLRLVGGNRKHQRRRKQWTSPNRERIGSHLRRVVTMDRATISFWLSIVGTTVAVVLAIIKGYEFFSDLRPRIKASVTLTGSEEIGNTIVLLNKSSIPANTSYFDLAWVERRSLFGWPIPFTRRVIADSSPIDPPDGYHVTIAPHDTHVLSFTEENHFDWGGDLKQDIYLRLWLIGHRWPIWIWIIGPREW